MKTFILLLVQAFILLTATAQVKKTDPPADKNAITVNAFIEKANQHKPQDVGNLFARNVERFYSVGNISPDSVVKLSQNYWKKYPKDRLVLGDLETYRNDYGETFLYRNCIYYLNDTAPPVYVDQYFRLDKHGQICALWQTKRST